VEAAPRKAESHPPDQERWPPAAPEETSVAAASPAREWPPPNVLGDVLYGDDERLWPPIPS